MLNLFVPRPEGLIRVDPAEDPKSFEQAVWVDLLDPTSEEETRVEQALKVAVPTREEMQEIEASNRLYEENGALFMTITLVTKLDTDLPQSTQATFILANGKLVTNRYTDPLPFRRFIAYAQTHPATAGSSALVFIGLLEAIVNRVADVLERVGTNLDGISAEVFAARRTGRGRWRAHDYRGVLSRVGQNGEIISKARESLVSLSRLLAFIQQTANPLVTAEARTRLRTVSRDVLAMSDHASFLGDKVSFALEATLGMVSIDQNNILKIFSVVTVFLLPPSVIGAIYGMNFHVIPWANEPWGFAAALGLMAVSALLPWLYFKRRGWL